jgi:hypothetical protein
MATKGIRRFWGQGGHGSLPVSRAAAGPARHMGRICQMNRRLLLAFAGATGALGLAGPAFAQRRGNPEPAAVGVAETHTAIVETVDQTARQVLLRGDEGSLHTVPLGPEVRNLAQLRSGDTVTVEFR